MGRATTAGRTTTAERAEKRKVLRGATQSAPRNDRPSCVGGPDGRPTCSDGWTGAGKNATLRERTDTFALEEEFEFMITVMSASGPPKHSYFPEMTRFACRKTNGSALARHFTVQCKSDGHNLRALKVCNKRFCLDEVVHCLMTA